MKKKITPKVLYKNVWLLYNFDNFIGCFLTKKSAIWEAENQLPKGTVPIKRDWKEYYQIYKGDLKIKIYDTKSTK